MNYRLIIRIKAEIDITNAAVWYGGVGRQFVAEVHAAMQRALTNPRQFPRLRRKPEVRRVLLRRFPYRVFFVLRPDTIVVFRVLHSARHDREWKTNLPEN